MKTTTFRPPGAGTEKEIEKVMKKRSGLERVNIEKAIRITCVFLKISRFGSGPLKDMKRDPEMMPFSHRNSENTKKRGSRKSTENGTPQK